MNMSPSAPPSAGALGLLYAGWKAVGVVGKSGDAVVPPTMTLPEGSYATALASSSPDPPSNVEQIRPPAESRRTTHPSLLTPTRSTAPDVVGKSGEKVWPTS